MPEDGWKDCFRIAFRSDTILCKVAEGGEPYGDPVMKNKAKKGDWLCRNPINGYTWTISRDGFDELYCESGKTSKTKEKKQEDGYIKGQSRHRSASHEDKTADSGPLFSPEIEEVESGNEENGDEESW